MSTVGKNINEVERIAAEQTGVKYAVALSCCTAALHLCVKLAGEKLYGKPAIGHGAVEGKRVFCSDTTFAATLNPVVYEGGIPVFIDTERDSWNMDPVAGIYKWVEKFEPEVVFFQGSSFAYAYKIVEKITTKYKIPLVLECTDDYTVPLYEKSIFCRLSNNSYLRVFKRCISKSMAVYAIQIY